MQFRAGIRLIAMAGAILLLAPVLLLAQLPDTPQRPWTYGSHADLQAATGRTLPALSEAPMLAQMVSSGDLPPVAERVPDEPLIVVPIEQVGSYGGQMNTKAIPCFG